MRILMATEVTFHSSSNHGAILSSGDLAIQPADYMLQVQRPHALCENGHMVIYTITHTGDVVDESVRENVLSLDEEEVNRLLEIAPGYKEEMESIAGVTYEYNAVDTSFYEKITINYKEADLEELIETNMVVVEESATYVSLQSILDEAEGLGLTCGEE